MAGSQALPAAISAGVPMQESGVAGLRPRLAWRAISRAENIRSGQITVLARGLGGDAGGARRPGPALDGAPRQSARHRRCIASRQGGWYRIGPVLLEVTATYPCARMDEARQGLLKALGKTWRGGVTCLGALEGGPIALAMRWTYPCARLPSAFLVALGQASHLQQTSGAAWHNRQRSRKKAGNRPPKHAELRRWVPPRPPFRALSGRAM